MEEVLSAARRLQDGEAVAVQELLAERNDLECHFDDLGFCYIAVNNWLLSSLESDPKARDLMFLNVIAERIGDMEDGAVVLASREADDAGMLICEIRERYAPDGYLYSVPANDHVLRA